MMKTNFAFSAKILDNFSKYSCCSKGCPPVNLVEGVLLLLNEYKHINLVIYEILASQPIIRIHSFSLYNTNTFYQPTSWCEFCICYILLFSLFALMIVSFVVCIVLTVCGWPLYTDLIDDHLNYDDKAAASLM